MEGSAGYVSRYGHIVRRGGRAKWSWVVAQLPNGAMDIEAVKGDGSADY